MKYILAILFSCIISLPGDAQSKNYAFYQLYQLDSIGNSPSINRHFGELYFHFLQLVEQRLEKADTATQRMIRHFEAVFAQFYIDACIARATNQPISLPAWRAYFTDSTLLRSQYYLLGANAHLNGGLAEAIAGSYTPAEWKALKKKYHIFNSCLNKTYKKVHEETISSSGRAKLLSILSFGLDKMVGQYYLYKWRKRQMRLTEYYFTGSPHYQRLLNKINRKKDRIDKMICTQL